MMHFEVYRDKNREHRWVLIASNGEKIAQGEGYKNLKDCRDAIRLVMNSGAAEVRIVERKEAS